MIQYQEHINPTTYKRRTNNQNTSNSKTTSSLLLIYVIIALLTPPVTILITLIIQCIKQKMRLKNSKETRTLSLNISSPIALNEAIIRQEHHNFISISHVMGYDWCTTIDDLKFMNFECTKKFFFIDLKLYMLDIRYPNWYSWNWLKSMDILTKYILIKKQDF